MGNYDGCKLTWRLSYKGFLGSFVSTRSGAKDCSIVETFPKKTVLGEI